MILQALCDYYDALARRGDITLPGWSVAKVSYALDIDGSGALRGVIPLKVKPEGAKRDVPQSLQVPEQLKRSGSRAPSYFLCDNTQYFLGLEKGVVTAKSLRCFQSCKETHLKMLKDCNCEEARAICNFFLAWNPENASSHPGLKSWYEKYEDGNFVFSVNRVFAHQVEEIQKVWDARDNKSEVIGRCMVSGEIGPIARIHNSVKGIYADSLAPNGWTLVGVDKEAFESYGKTQGFNSPISEKSAFSYTTALNHLLRDKSHVQRIGDTTVVYWAEDAEPLDQDIFSCAMFGGTSEVIADSDLKAAVMGLANGDPVDVNGIPLRPDNRFYVLGLAPNAARLSVRFFLPSTFGQMLANVQAHYERLDIVKPAYAANGTLPIWRLLGETVNPNSRDKKASPLMAGAVLRAILSDGPYPASLLEQTMLRIRAQQDITYGKAAILKAFFTKNREYQVPEEVLTVELNDQSNYLPYVLGRLFAVLERVQSAANPGLNATIKDKYFNSACATPATIFPLLTKLSQSHLRKLEGGLKVYYEKIIGDLEGRIRETLPARMGLADQGTFQLGYYHQVQKFYEKKEKGGNSNV